MVTGDAGRPPAAAKFPAPLLDAWVACSAGHGTEHRLRGLYQGSPDAVAGRGPFVNGFVGPPLDAQAVRTSAGVEDGGEDHVALSAAVMALTQ